jgi:hypothetical protein
VTEPQGPAASEPGRQCPWCAAPADDAATRCSACGAALAQRESIAGVLIPGLTGLDPALEDYDKRPLHISGPSPSQGMAPALMVAAAAGGPVGLMAVGGVAAVMAAEYMGASRGGPGGVGLESVGKPSEVVLQALERLEDGSLDSEASPAADAAGPGAAQSEAAEAEATGAEAAEPEPTAAAAADDGRSIWRDLPPVDPSLAGPDPDPTPES